MSLRAHDRGGGDQREVNRERGAQARCAGGFCHRRRSLAVENRARPKPPHFGSHPAIPGAPHGTPFQEDHHSRRKTEALPGRNTPLPLSGKHFVNGSNIKQPAAGGLEEAVFGLGCFWGAERKFWQIPGVVTTAVGYAGGYTPNATYEEVCSGRTGHTEVVRVVYDPNKVSYDTLLKAFWESHDPTQGMRQGGDVGTQYRSAIYTTTDAQHTGRRSEQALIPGSADQGASRDHHHRDQGRAGVLLRRGIPPAVPGEESRRLLRAWWVRSCLQGVIAMRVVVPA